MIRGTTPTICMNIVDGGELDLTRAADLYVTLRQGNTVITKNEGVEVAAQSVGFSLTQREALRLRPGSADVQINWTYENPDGTKRREATRVRQIEIAEQLLDEVI